MAATTMATTTYCGHNHNHDGLGLYFVFRSYVYDVLYYRRRYIGGIMSTGHMSQYEVYRSISLANDFSDVIMSLQ